MDSAKVLANRYLLALCVWREARGETALGKQLVATVVLNRVADTRWPNTLLGVITQRWQFSSFNLDDPNVTQYPGADDPAWAACVDAADAAFGAHVPLTTANHYHVAGLDPSWRDATKITNTEGHHVFYCL